jgi:hypothetical protein
MNFSIVPARAHVAHDNKKRVNTKLEANKRKMRTFTYTSKPQ